ncbi:MAG: hypothetical protein A2Y81_00145 [Nitrospirae bacterium RBG_13_43_8]|nr:MAG: hypothetical protein A2Y81_00145 [Nitrospirae bacterium RBG_13_43_8]
MLPPGSLRDERYIMSIHFATGSLCKLNTYKKMNESPTRKSDLFRHLFSLKWHILKLNVTFD